ncbi:MAG TPA: HD domain-containing protein [Kofleriaceae bacterium]|nr:HD domain-containing protein [Kofleriaceae bacterium]
MDTTTEPSAILRLSDSPDTRARIHAWAEANPVLLLDIAGAIGVDGELPPEAVTAAAADTAAAIAGAGPVEVRQALEGALLGRHVDVALEWMRATGMLAILFPELEATVHLVQETGRQHKDVWNHTRQVVKQSVRRPLVRWAALLHDIGKVPTRTFTAEGVHFHGHAEVGARMFDKIAQRLPFDRDQRKTVRFLIKHHLRSSQYSDQWSDSAVRRFHREMAPHLRDLLDLSRADITSKRPGRRQQILAQISALSDRMDRLAEEDARLPPLPGGVGNAIMEAFALAPSRLVGDLKRALEAAVTTGDLEARREDAYYVAALARAGLVPGMAPDQMAALVAAGGLVGQAAADADAREAAGEVDEPLADVEPRGHDGDPDRPHDGPAPCDDPSHTH